eukprot:Plantae.Rhodophyta-Purpureofilum_apyrenoidigerum.ctg13459.p1 GENE.Plantae.Rhodophyta-Purpureofilum_apyrenoidigerum.ctg13459~~Plantae.Rhodophyta-Purpureofilum_apyrenoidigerum.ctg13459.p1  ORF type:complete len:355 (+),score=42.51 Plantae.Rhodophyta-Purpureofilum_apyrenoidigerum.ctg13459:155-1219(+)
MAALEAVLVSLGRYLAATLVMVITFPLLLPAVLQLPYGQITSYWHRIAQQCLSLIAGIAGVDFQFLSPVDVQVNSEVHAPLVKVWTSNARCKGGKNVLCRTYDQPGRWMGDNDLLDLQLFLKNIAVESMECVPTHALFDRQAAREVFSNRVVTIAFCDSKPVAFTAMVYIPYAGSSILHLGLTMVAKSHRGMRIQSSLFTKCLVMPMFSMRRLSYFVTNIGASPAGIGAVSDYFLDSYPHYNGQNKCTVTHLAIAKYILDNYRSEFACSEEAVFNESTFVVHGSNKACGGGAPEFIKEDGNPVSFYKNEACNDFCRKRLDLTAGDELFQVAKVNFVFTSLKFLTSGMGQKSKRV